MLKRRYSMKLSLKMFIFQFFNFMLKIAVFKDKLAHFFFYRPHLFDKMFVFHSFSVIFSLKLLPVVVDKVTEFVNFY